MPWLVRADATPEMGTGHFMRSLALTRACLEMGHEVEFVTRCSNAPLLTSICQTGAKLRALAPDAPDLPKMPLAGVEGVVLDGYHFDGAFQKAIKDRGLPLAVIDDTAHLPYYFADVILNQNIGANRLTYACSPGATLLLGARYALLRPEFKRWREWCREIPDTARKILVTMGGSDPDNATARVVRALQSVALPLNITVVLGPANRYVENVRHQALGDPRIQVLVNPPEIDALMAWADLAISAAGSTCWELCCIRTPTITLVLADNQRDIAAGLAEAGIAFNLGNLRHISEGAIAAAVGELCTNRARREQMSLDGGELVDCMGANRVAAVLQSMVRGSE
jgi:UDP-2,4-diacetamido-2,4,6-trideoxy-beta-L-altropyranose hydrolase